MNPIKNNAKGAKISLSDANIDSFWRWFAGSKTVDRLGRPLVLYHGTDQDIHSFDEETIGNNFRADTQGFFFTSNPKEASDYAENDTVGLYKRENANVIPAYVSLKNPLIIDDYFLKNEGMHPIGINEDTISFWDSYQSLIFEWAQYHKADGIILVDHSYQLNGEPTRLVVALRPNQIKSSIGNSGAFNASDNEITDRETISAQLRLDVHFSELERHPAIRETRMRR